MKLSYLLNTLFIGHPANAVALARLSNVTIDATTGGHTLTPGPDLFLSTGQFKATKTWNAVWNDIADFQQIEGELAVGKCYFDTPNGARLCNSRCQMGVIGIVSDTFAMGIGQGRFQQEAPFAVAGWALAYVDNEYQTGTPLTNDEYGLLTEMTLEEKRDFPERLVATYKKKETAASFGTPGSEINVNGRHWVKIK